MSPVPLDPSALAEALGLARVARGAMGARLALVPDTLHRVLRCGRCGALTLDTRAFEGTLQLVEGGRRPCASLAELGAFLDAHALVLHAGDAPDACPCGAPWVTLQPVAARFFHAVPGTGAELMTEIAPGPGASAAQRWAHIPVDGDPVWWDGEGAVDAWAVAAFGRPLALSARWQMLWQSPGGGLAAIEQGFWLYCAPVGATEASAALESLVASGPSLRVVALSPRAVQKPAWAWLREAMAAPGARDAVVATVIDADHFVRRIALAAARVAMEARRDAAGWWLCRQGISWPLNLPAAMDEAMVLGLDLSAAAAAAVAVVSAQIDRVAGFLQAAMAARPGLQFAQEGDAFVPVRAGAPAGTRPIPLGVAAALGGDGAAIERDLRFHLDEAPPWADRWRVCPCGAARRLTVGAVSSSRLASMLAAEGAGLLHWPDTGVASGAGLLALACDRHVDYALGALAADAGLSAAEVVARYEDDLRRAEYLVQVAAQGDAPGRGVWLVQGESVGAAAIVPGWRRALVQLLVDAPDVCVEVLSGSSVLAWETDADRGRVAQVAAAGRWMASQRAEDVWPEGARWPCRAEHPLWGVFAQLPEG